MILVDILFSAAGYFFYTIRFPKDLDNFFNLFLTGDQLIHFRSVNGFPPDNHLRGTKSQRHQFDIFQDLW